MAHLYATRETHIRQTAVHALDGWLAGCMDK